MDFLGVISTYITKWGLDKLVKRAKRWGIPLVLAIFAFFAAWKLFHEGWRPKLVFEQNTVGLLFLKKNLAFSSSEKAADSVAPTKPEITQLFQDCPEGYLCSEFKDEDFSGWSEYSRSSRNPRMLTVSSDSDFDNPPLLFRKGSTGINFEMFLQAVPMNKDKANIVVLYNKIWRCTIGEANYNTVSCQYRYDSKNSQPQKPNFLSSLGKGPISPGNPIIINVRSILTAENKNKVELNLRYIDIYGNNADAQFVYTFALPNPDIENFEELVGVGIIDPKEEKVEVEFKFFKLLKK